MDNLEKKILVNWKIISRSFYVLIAALFFHDLFLAARYGIISDNPFLIRNVCLDVMGMFMLGLMFYSVNRLHIYSRTGAMFIILIVLTDVYLYMDTICWLVDGIQELITANYIFNTAFYAMPVIMFWFFWNYICALNDRKPSDYPRRTKVFIIVSVIYEIIVWGNLFNHYIFSISADGVYSRSSTYFLSVICPTVLFFLVSHAIIKQHFSLAEKLALLSYPLFPVFNSVLSVLSKYPSMLAIEVFASVFFLYTGIFVRRIQYAERKEVEVIQLNNQLTEARVNLMISQMQPHFISNTLGMIRSLYRKSPEKAEQAMNTFIGYLQKNFSDLNSTSPIMAEKEIEHVKQFVQLELMRWPDIEVEYDIKATNFYLPAMTLQPLVENAIRHGLMPLEKGGKIIISTWEDEENYYAQVKDNGVGFDVDNPKPQYEDNRKHIGVPNIRDRLREMCNGQLTIESTEGVGTTATISISKI